MTPTKIFKNAVAPLFVVVLSAPSASSAAQGIQTISHGEQVDLTASLVPGKLTLIDFYADWCGPCRSLAPTLERLAAAKSDVLAIKKIDIVNWDSAVTAQYRIQSIPHLKLFGESGQLLVEGDPAHVMRVLESRLGGSGSDSRGGRSLAPVFLIGGLAAIALFFLLRGKSAPNQAPSPPLSPLKPGEAPPSGWFVMIQNSLEGPFGEEDLEELVRRRKLPATAKARRKGQSTWTTVEEIVEHLM